MTRNDPRKPQDRREDDTPSIIPNGSGLIVGLLVFAIVYGLPYFLIFRVYGEVSEGSNLLFFVLGVFSGWIGAAIEYALRNKGRR